MDTLLPDIYYRPSIFCSYFQWAPKGKLFSPFHTNLPTSISHQAKFHRSTLYKLSKRPFSHLVSLIACRHLGFLRQIWPNLRAICLFKAIIQWDFWSKYFPYPQMVSLSLRLHACQIVSKSAVYHCCLTRSISDFEYDVLFVLLYRFRSISAHRTFSLEIGVETILWSSFDFITTILAFWLDRVVVCFWSQESKYFYLRNFSRATIVETHHFGDPWIADVCSMNGISFCPLKIVSKFVNI